MDGGISGLDPRPTWLLVSGAPRSGTTLVQHILNSHPQIACLHEYGIDTLFSRLECLFNPGSDRPWQASEGDAVAKIDMFSESRLLAAKHFSGDPFLVPRRSWHLNKIVEAIYSKVSGKDSLLVLADKMPNLNDPDRIVKIRNLIGGSIKIIYIVRNPLSVVTSSMRRAHMTAKGQDDWPIHTVYQAIAEWLDNWEHFSDQYKLKDENHLFIKYEDLVYEYSSYAASLSAFLGVADRFKNLVAPMPSELVDFRLDDEIRSKFDQTIGPLADDWSKKTLDQLATSDTRFFCQVPINTEIRLGTNEKAPLFLRKGFYKLENWGVWSRGHNAELCFSIQESIPELYIKLRFNCFMGLQEKFEFTASINGGPPELRIVTKKESAEAGFVCRLGSDAKQVRVELAIPHVKSPSDPPFHDMRLLGLGLISFSVTNARGLDLPFPANWSKPIDKEVK